MYDCATCPAFTRAIRGCAAWPPPEVEQLNRLAPDLLPVTTERDEMLDVLERTAWPTGQTNRLSQDVRAALQFAKQHHRVDEPCPINDISAVSHRFIRHYHRLQAFRSEMGGMVPPGRNLHDADIRTVHAFNVISTESERLRQLDRKGDA